LQVSGWLLVDKQIKNVSDSATIATNNATRKAAADQWLTDTLGGAQAAIVKLVIGGVVISAIALIAVSGVKRTID
jgi:hypothetical protein